jgi:hypothetical protein
VYVEVGRGEAGRVLVGPGGGGFTVVGFTEVGFAVVGRGVADAVGRASAFTTSSGVREVHHQKPPATTTTTSIEMMPSLALARRVAM